MDKLSQGLTGIVSASSPKPKINILIKEVENGYVIHLDKNGYAHGEQTRIAKNGEEIMNVVSDILSANKVE